PRGGLATVALPGRFLSPLEESVYAALVGGPIGAVSGSVSAEDHLGPPRSRRLLTRRPARPGGENFPSPANEWREPGPRGEPIGPPPLTPPWRPRTPNEVGIRAWCRRAGPPHRGRPGLGPGRVS